jgi:hypothetical protein
MADKIPTIIFVRDENKAAKNFWQFIDLITKDTNLVVDTVEIAHFMESFVLMEREDGNITLGIPSMSYFYMSNEELKAIVLLAARINSKSELLSYFTMKKVIDLYGEKIVVSALAKHSLAIRYLAEPELIIRKNFKDSKAYFDFIIKTRAELSSLDEEAISAAYPVIEYFFSDEGDLTVLENELGKTVKTFPNSNFLSNSERVQF